MCLSRTAAAEATGLVKDFGRIRALDGFDITIPKGSLYALVGPNGAGKTTAIKVFMGLLRPTGGIAKVLGGSPEMARRKGLASYMPQDTAMYSGISVMDNLRIFGSMYGLNSPAIARRGKELLEFVGLSGRSDSRVSTLSGGMMRRASLACALLPDTPLVFLDEPTVGVDPELRTEFWRHFSELSGKGRTVVITTHYMDEARRCDLVGMMARGGLMVEGPPGKLMKEAGTAYLEDAYLHFSRAGGDGQ